MKFNENSLNQVFEDAKREVMQGALSARSTKRTQPSEPRMGASPSTSCWGMRPMRCL